MPFSISAFKIKMPIFCLKHDFWHLKSYFMAFEMPVFWCLKRQNLFMKWTLGFRIFSFFGLTWNSNLSCQILNTNSLRRESVFWMLERPKVWEFRRHLASPSDDCHGQKRCMTSRCLLYARLPSASSRERMFCDGPTSENYNHLTSCFELIF